MSGPYLYFAFPDVQVFDLSDEVPTCDFIIYGGGAIAGRLHRRQPHLAVMARKRIAWGIGSSCFGQNEPGPLPSGFDLLGSRDRLLDCYSPCPSCMSYLFDRITKPVHKLIVYLNDDTRIPRPSGITGLPIAGNWIKPGSSLRTSFEDVINFLASGETVLTNSYHGAYWATLLGRKVVAAPAYSSKLQNLKYPPITCNADNWRDSIQRAIAYPEALDDSRIATQSFYERVCDIVSKC